MRMEMLGLNFTAQHSDARVLDQLLYKWAHSRVIIGRVLADKYADLLNSSGWVPTKEEVTRDARYLLRGSYEEFMAKDLDVHDYITAKGAGEAPGAACC